MYLFCVAMPLDRAVGIVEAAGARVCCQGVEDICFDVALYTEQHIVHPTGGLSPSGDDEYRLTPRVESQRRRKWAHRWRCWF
jgi:hypothetical protein